MARAIQLRVSHALERDRMGSMRQALESVFSIGRVYSAYIYDQSGKEIMRLGPPHPESKNDQRQKLPGEGEKRYGEYGRIAGRQVYSYFVPLTDLGGRVTGMLHLTRKKSDFENHLHSIGMQGILSLGALLVILSFAVLFGHHLVLGRFLDKLSCVMSSIAEGDRKQRYKMSGPREISVLGGTLNHMLDSI